LLREAAALPSTHSVEALFAPGQLAFDMDVNDDSHPRNAA
jgi:hypothetical protein